MSKIKNDDKGTLPAFSSSTFRGKCNEEKNGYRNNHSKRVSTPHINKLRKNHLKLTKILAIMLVCLFITSFLGIMIALQGQNYSFLPPFNPNSQQIAKNGWQTGENITVWRCPRLVYGQDNAYDLINMQDDDGDAYYEVLVAPRAEWKQIADVGDTLRVDAELLVGVVNLNVYVYNWTGTSWTLRGTIAGGNRGTVTHTLVADEVNADNESYWRVTRETGTDWIDFYYNNIEEKEWYIVETQYLYASYLLYFKSSFTGYSTTSEQYLYFYVPNEWSFENTTATLVAQTRPYGFNYFPQGYVLKGANSTYEAYFVSNPEYNVSVSDDTYSSGSYTGGNSQIAPFPLMNFPDGAGDYLTIVMSTDTVFTASVWVNFGASFSDWESVMIKRALDNSNAEWGIGTSDAGGTNPGDQNDLYFWTRDSTAGTFRQTLIQADLSTNTWYHVIVSFDNGLKNVTAWLDGVKVLDSVNHGFSFTVYNSPLNLGWRATTVNTLTGYECNLVYYSRVISDGEAAQIYNQPYNSPTTPRLWLPFLEKSGATTYDISGNNLDGTLAGNMARAFGTIGTSDGDILTINPSANLYTYQFNVLASSLTDDLLLNYIGEGGFFYCDYDGSYGNIAFDNGSYDESVLSGGTVKVIMFWGYDSSSSFDYLKAFTYSPYNAYYLDYSGDSSSGSLTSIHAIGNVTYDCGYPNIYSPTTKTVTLKLYENDVLKDTINNVNGSFDKTFTYTHIQANYAIKTEGYLNDTWANYTVHKIEYDNHIWYYSGTVNPATKFMPGAFYDLKVSGAWNGGGGVSDLRFSVNYTGETNWNKDTAISFPLNITYYLQITPLYTNSSGYDFAIMGTPQVISVVVSTADINITNIYWTLPYFPPTGTISFIAELYFNESDPFMEGYVLSKIMLSGVPVGVSCNSSVVFHNHSYTNVTLFHYSPLWTSNEYIDLEIYDLGLNLLTYLYNVSIPWEENPTVSTPYVQYAKSNFATWEAVSFNYTALVSENASHYLTVRITRSMYGELPYYVYQYHYVNITGNISGSASIAPNGILRSYWLPADTIKLEVFGETGDLLKTYTLTVPMTFYGNTLTFTLVPSKTIVSDIEAFTCQVLYAFTSQDMLPKLSEIDVTWGSNSFSYYQTLSFGANSLNVIIPPAGSGQYPNTLTISITVPSLSLFNSSSSSMTVYKSGLTQLLDTIPTLVQQIYSQQGQLENSQNQVLQVAVIGGLILVVLGAIVAWWWNRRREEGRTPPKGETPRGTFDTGFKKAPPPKKFDTGFKKAPTKEFPSYTKPKPKKYDLKRD